MQTALDFDRFCDALWSGGVDVTPKEIRDLYYAYRISGCPKLMSIPHGEKLAKSLRYANAKTMLYGAL